MIQGDPTTFILERRNTRLTEGRADKRMQEAKKAEKVQVHSPPLSHPAQFSACHSRISRVPNMPCLCCTTLLILSFPSRIPFPICIFQISTNISESSVNVTSVIEPQ